MMSLPVWLSGAGSLSGGSLSVQSGVSVQGRGVSVWGVCPRESLSGGSLSGTPPIL